MTNKSRTAIFGIGVLFAVLALTLLLVPGYGAALAVIFALVVAAGLAGMARPQRLSQLTAYDR